MKRVLLAIVSTVAAMVMLLSFKSHTVSASPVSVPAAVRQSSSSSSSADGSSGSGDSGSSTSSTSPAAASPSATATASATSGTYTGDSVDTRWGPVQVRITVENGKITAATAVDYPQNNQRDEEINSYAVPTLERETVSAGNAQIDMVSGATYTSEGYLSSLQSALDKAGLS